jgi:hypothetical protein
MQLYCCGAIAPTREIYCLICSVSIPEATQFTPPQHAVLRERSFLVNSASAIDFSGTRNSVSRMHLGHTMGKRTKGSRLISPPLRKYVVHFCQAYVGDASQDVLDTMHVRGQRRRRVFGWFIGSVSSNRRNSVGLGRLHLKAKEYVLVESILLGAVHTEAATDTRAASERLR